MIFINKNFIAGGVAISGGGKYFSRGTSISDLRVIPICASLLGLCMTGQKSAKTEKMQFSFPKFPSHLPFKLHFPFHIIYPFQIFLFEITIFLPI